MTVAESLYFVYDGKRSDEMGIINVNLETGMLEENFLPEQNIKEITIRGKDAPYYMEKNRNPITLKLTFAFVADFNEEKLKHVSSWLANQPYYKPLYFSDNLNKWYYTLYTGEVKLIHNALKQGYITIEMRNISPYTYSPIYQSGIYDYSLNTSDGMDFTINNLGTLPCKPIIKLEKVGAGEVKIVNYSNRGKEFLIKNLVHGEFIEIDSDTEDISSNIPLTYHFDDTSGKYLISPKGIIT